MKVCIVVTHLLGTGHLARALTLARAFKTAGHMVTILSGGMPAAHLRADGIPMLHLPPLRSDGVDFTRLLDKDGKPASDALLAMRREMLVAQITADPPDVLITELFPFGRRILRAEFHALLEAALALPRRPLICASIRDILAPPSKPAKAALADELIGRFYDAVLVHADKDVTPLSLSWPVSKALEGKLHYTGFVAPPPAGADVSVPGKDQIVVSAGGGAVGGPVFATALAAAARNPSRRWRLLVAGQDSARRIAGLAATAPSNVTLTPASPTFRQMLYHAAASISLCGYNTALDVLQSGVRAVFVPFEDGSEVEQGLRADALSKLPGIAVLRAADMSAQRLLDTLDIIMAEPDRPPRIHGFDGAERTVRIAEDLRRRVR